MANLIYLFSATDTADTTLECPLMASPRKEEARAVVREWMITTTSLNPVLATDARTSEYEFVAYVVLLREVALWSNWAFLCFIAI